MRAFMRQDPDVPRDSAKTPLPVNLSDPGNLDQHTGHRESHQRRENRSALLPTPNRWRTGHANSRKSSGQFGHGRLNFAK